MKNALKMTRNSGIDLFRIIGCFSIILLHQSSQSYGEFGFVSDLFDQITRWAVPFFFIAAGYFLTTDEKPLKNILKYCARLAPPFIFWVIFYLVVFQTFDQFLSLSGLFQILIHGGTGFHLWFLSSLGVCITLFVLSKVYFSVHNILYLAAFLYVFGLVFGSYEKTILDFDLPFNTRNGPFFGFIFLAIGAYLKKSESAFSFQKGVKLAGIGVVLSALEILFLLTFYDVALTRHDFLMGTLPFGVGCFIMAKNCELPSYGTQLSTIGQVTLGIYCVHLFILAQLNILISPNGLISGLTVAVLTFVLSTLVALIGGHIPYLKRLFA